MLEEFFRFIQGTKPSTAWYTGLQAAVRIEDAFVILTLCGYRVPWVLSVPS